MADLFDNTDSRRTLTVADLNITINHEPRIHDLRLAEALGFANRHMIRTLIKNHMASLRRFGEVSLAREKPGKQGGRPGTAHYLNRRQALYITAKSDTPRAAEITVEMVEVFDAYLAGKTVEAPKAIPAPKPEIPLPPQPKKFEEGSDILRDLISAVLAANLAVERGQAKTFGDALEKVLGNIDVQRRDAEFQSDLSLYDWNLVRSSATRRANLRTVPGGKAVVGR